MAGTRTSPLASVRVWIVFALIVAGVVLVAAAPTRASESDPALSVGVQFHGTWSSYSDAQRTAVLDRLAEAGVGWVRIDIGWASFQENGPESYSQWYVDLVDRLVNGARARGMRVLGTLWMTPGWANGGQDTRVPPTDDASYARIARWAAEHFRGRVAAWEVWNEPNLSSSFVGDAARYARLLKAAYPGFKAGDPSASVVLGGPVNNDARWLSDVYRAGARGAFDVMATHPYQGPSDLPPEAPDDGTMWRLSHVAAVRDLMVANGDGGKPIWFTEFGWSSHENGAGVENWNRGVTEQQQADYLVRTLAYVRSTFPYVTNVFWYNERNNTNGNIQYNNYGLLRNDLTPKPVYTALKTYLLGGAATPAAVAPVPAAFSKVSPAAGRQGVSTAPNLTWAASAGATASAVCVDSTNDSVCSGAWVAVAGTTFRPTVRLAPRTRYYWHVRASNAAGERQSNSGQWWAFRTS